MQERNSGPFIDIPMGILWCVIVCLLGAMFILGVYFIVNYYPDLNRLGEGVVLIATPSLLLYKMAAMVREDWHKWRNGISR